MPTEVTTDHDAAEGVRAEALQRFAARALELGELQRLLAEHVLTSLGRRALAELAPLDDEGVRAALARVAEAQRLGRAQDLPSLGALTDPAPLLDELRRRALDEEELARLAAFLFAQERLKHWLERRADDVPELARLGERSPDLSPLRDRIAQVVDERGRVLDTASPLLARLRRDVRDIGRRIDESLRRIAGRSDVKNLLSDPRPQLRGGRLCLAVKAKSSGRVRGIVHDRSQTEQTVFVEPREVVELANKRGECQHQERVELSRILSELSRAVLEARETLLAAAAELMRLELALLCADFCAVYGARVPLLPGERGAADGLLLRSARHPLLVEQLLAGELPEVVPIDLRLGGDFDMLIVTGPNTGGKTLALKTAGLLALMVRLGLPIPCAEGSTVPLYDGVAADIGDEQEISQSLSTFSSHLVRIRAGLEVATERTLVLLDELGGGTDPDEGAALGEAILAELLERKVPALVSTHLGRLKEFAFRNARAENGCTEFDLATLAPRYRLIVGVPGESAALVIARRLGLPGRVVDGAEARLERRDEEVQELMAEVREVRSEAEQVRSRAEERLEEAERKSRELSASQVELDSKRERVEAEAQRGIEERLRGARGWIERARALLPQVGGATRSELGEVLAKVEAELTGASMTERRQAFLAGLKKGAFVYLPKYRQRVQVHRVFAERQELAVKLGSLRVTLGFDEVTEYESL